MMKCPYCSENESFILVTDGLWSNEYFIWDSKKKKYVLQNSKYDGNGDQYVECGTCGKQINDSDFTEKFWKKIDENGTEKELIVEVSGGVCTDVYHLEKDGTHTPVAYTLKDFDNE